MIFIPNKSIDLHSVDIIKFLKSQFNLTLVRLHIHDENQSVVLLDLLHRALGVEGVENDLVRIETRCMRNRLAGVLGRPGELKGLRAVEGGGSADLASLVRLVDEIS